MLTIGEPVDREPLQSWAEVKRQTVICKFVTALSKFITLSLNWYYSTMYCDSNTVLYIMIFKKIFFLHEIKPKKLKKKVLAPLFIDITLFFYSRYFRYWLGLKKKGVRPFIDHMCQTGHKPIYGNFLIEFFFSFCKFCLWYQYLESLEDTRSSLNTPDL